MKPQSIEQKIDVRMNTLIGNLVTDFDLTGVNKSPARFNTKKLQDINSRFIRMMDLEEFAYRAQRIKISKKYDDLKLRVGDYAYLVDTTIQEIFVGYKQSEFDSTQVEYFPLGGGRESEESWSTNLAREINEETNDQLIIDTSSALEIISIHIKSDSFIREGAEWEGKSFHFYFIPTKRDLINTTIVDEKYPADWKPLVDVLASNTHLTYPIYKEFCIQHSIPYPEPTSEIIRQYCAWSLDQNRITTLNEFGTESTCILDWKKPELGDVQWKKSSVPESISNLKEVFEFVESQYDNNPHRFPERIDQVSHYMQQASMWWEETIKAWLSEMEYSAGDYLWPLRVALSGQTKSPSPFELLAILGKEEARERISLIVS